MDVALEVHSFVPLQKGTHLNQTRRDLGLFFLFEMCNISGPLCSSLHDPSSRDKRCGEDVLLLL
jgi:hypothetical protein